MTPTTDFPQDATQQAELTLQERRERLLKPEAGEKHFGNAWNQLSPWPGDDTENDFQKALEEFKEIFG